MRGRWFGKGLDSTPPDSSLATLSAEDAAQLKRAWDTLAAAEAQAELLRRGWLALVGPVAKKYGLPERFDVDYQTGKVYATEVKP